MKKPDMFADYLPFHHQVTRQAQEIKYKKNYDSNSNKWKKISDKEVKWNIKQLRNSSSGPDNIHNRCLKNHTKLLIFHLTNLFNMIMKMGYIPNMWKKANIILLLKPKKDKHHPASYRPISLLSCMGKLLEKIIKQRLLNVLERRKILAEHQAGFHPRKSTLYDIIRLERFANE
jgi:hypothetical protein